MKVFDIIKNIKNKNIFNKFFIIFLFIFLNFIFFSQANQNTDPNSKNLETDIEFNKMEYETEEIIPINLDKPKYIRGIHISAWAAGSSKFIARYEKIIQNTEINTIVIAVKEANGEVYIDGVAKTKKIGAYKKAMPKIKEYIDYLHTNQVFVIARIVLFKDPILAKKEPDLAVKDSSGNIWKDYKGLSWVDPFNKKTWEYNFEVVDACLEAGFDEIQFDYIRYPSDGNIKECKYTVEFSSTNAVNNLIEFLKETDKRYGHKTRISIDIFGLVISSNDGLGIGQVIEKFEPYVDAISPMMYPSHYAKGSYGLKEPNKSPYKTIYYGMISGKKKLKENSYKYIPYLQDFNMGYKYGIYEIREQIQGLYDNDIGEWILWDPKSLYTTDALLPKSESDKYRNMRKEREIREMKELEEIT
ncbi:MAG: putative glycoside hydrolase [Elusimicrobiota bacterium]|nr:putative glycoside hydrolase [Elusimicrobiota bacterium]